MEGANATLQCHLMSGDFEYSDQYTSTIDDNLTQDKAVMSSLWANDLKSKACYCGVSSGCACDGMTWMPSGNQHTT
jgi:hypothetical protein